MAADRQIELDDMHAASRERRLDVAVAFADDRRSRSSVPGRTRPARAAASSTGGKLLDVELDQIGGVLGEIGVVGEHHGDRLADIAHAVASPARTGDRARAPSSPVRRKSIGGMSRDIRERSRPHARPAAPAPRSHRSPRSLPCATGERTTRMCSWPGNEMSAAKRPCPVTSGRSSSRVTERPMNLPLAALIYRRASRRPRRAPP